MQQLFRTATGHMRSLRSVALTGLRRATPDGDGFCEEQGLFALFTDSNRVQVRLDGRDRALVNPVFLVSGSEGMEAWVYVDYAILDRTARDSRDRLLFELPGVIDRETVLEVYLRRHQ